ncbi:MAG: hypothetical protein GDA52_01495 [Rhodobacteraceae bacterium]|nr:hypothetical protein [Paracoccaceae bacterium]
MWKEAGHDGQADIRIRTNGKVWPVNVKSGKIRRESLVLSGHRLGRFQGDFGAISDYLNTPVADIIAVPHEAREDATGRHHIYTTLYIPKEMLQGADATRWERQGAQYIQTSDKSVLFSLRPAMSWQIWWTIPIRGLVSERALQIT